MDKQGVPVIAVERAVSSLIHYRLVTFGFSYGRQK